MTHKLLAVLLAIVMVSCGIPFGTMAEYAPPTVFGAPEDFAVHPREDGTEKTWTGFDATVSASAELLFMPKALTADRQKNDDAYITVKTA